MKRWMLFIWLGVLTAGILGLFWYNDWRYQLPTPVPEDYKAVNIGTAISLSGGLSKQNDKPLFLHFFNPDCPCSKFNIKHFKSLVKNYGTQAKFAIVVMSDQGYSETSIRNKFDLDLPISFDTSLATICGVYSTPQAVILNANHNLYYRGNYNKARYCTDPKTNYAQLALEKLLANQPSDIESPYAMKAYGCQLPKCTLK